MDTEVEVAPFGPRILAEGQTRAGVEPLESEGPYPVAGRLLSTLAPGSLAEVREKVAHWPPLSRV